MSYELKNKITVTEEFLNELIAKSWQEAESLQQQIANIDISTRLGAEVVNILKNTCTNTYVLIGCLEALLDNNELKPDIQEIDDLPRYTSIELDYENNPVETIAEPTNDPTEVKQSFEPFEYFVDFDEPSGEPLTDDDLYN